MQLSELRASKCADACTVRGICQLSRELAELDPGAGSLSQLSFMPWQLETPSVPKSYSKGGRSESVSYLPGAWQTSTPDLQQLGQLFCGVYPPCLCGNMGGFKGGDIRQQVPSGRDGVLEFERMHRGQVRKELVLCSWAAQSMGHRVCGVTLVHPEWLK